VAARTHIPRVTDRALAVAQTFAECLDPLINQLVEACAPLPLAIRREANSVRESLDLVRHLLREETQRQAASAVSPDP
jgi:hypothetical protein